MNSCNKIHIIIITLIFSTGIIQSQNQANIWHFGKLAGLDFNTGEPILIYNPFLSLRACASISDEEGVFLFATNAEKIYNRNNQIMQNGDNLEGHHFAAQGALIVQKPKSNNLYYVFTTGFVQGSTYQVGLYYSVVDMNLDGGLGAVTDEKNVLLADAWDANDKIVALKHENKEDIWIITRKFIDDGYAAFLLTKNGVNVNSVYSPSIDRDYDDCMGNIKVSPSKKYLVSAYNAEATVALKPDVEICNFNLETGEVGFLYTLRFNVDENVIKPNEPWGVEFSPDSRYLYLSIFTEREDDLVDIFQFDMQYIEDSTQFYDTKIKIADAEAGKGLQLARDGKIYCTGPSTGFYDYLSVIHRPWEKGTSCQYEKDAVFLDFDGGGRQTGQFLPNILVDHLFRFEWEGRCQSQAFVFQNNFIPGPVYIRWSFSDPAAGADSISYDLNPTHYFSHAGEFEVKVTVNYPSGRVEKTSRVVTVVESPQPNLGPDTLMCQNGEITLNSNESGMHVWSTLEFGMDKNEITVNASGEYWVKVSNNLSCSTIDSINIALYPNSQIDETNLQIIPTTCSGSSGEINGLAVTGEPPLNYQWYDGSNNLISTTLNINNLSVGNYYLHISDGHGCTTLSNPYTIIDAGDIEISQIDKENTHCNQDTASINITATPNPNSLLYSIDDGINWQTANPLFENLSAGSYFIRAKDASGCEGVFEDNPVIIENIAGPYITNTATTAETDNFANGQIDITATTITATDLHYSINNGTNYQINDGHFANLTAGTYHCVVKDNFYCDTLFVLIVEKQYSQIVDAIAGNGNTCMGEVAVVPIKVNNFTDIYKFTQKLTYDTAMLDCQGYININPTLEENLTVSIIPETDEIQLNWQGIQEESLIENATILELVFQAKEQGMGGIDWAAQTGESGFYNKDLEEINTEYHTGSLRVYTRPEIILSEEQEICENDTLFVFPFVNGGSGEREYLWQGPDNYNNPSQFLLIENIQQNQEGKYQITVTDTVGCKEEKQIEIIVNPAPEIDFADYDTLFLEQGQDLDAGQGYNIYYWNTGDTTHSIPIYTEGPYSVEVISGNGCISLAATVVFWDEAAFILPTAFSPNGDGLNDEFKAIYRHDFIKTFQLNIYNRWGQQIFEAEDINTGWDGTYNGQSSPKGNYIYKITYTSYPDYNKTKSVSGNVVLLR